VLLLLRLLRLLLRLLRLLLRLLRLLLRLLRLLTPQPPQVLQARDRQCLHKHVAGLARRVLRLGGLLPQDARHRGR